jgi:hypothetical protein
VLLCLLTQTRRRHMKKKQRLAQIRCFLALLHYDTHARARNPAQGPSSKQTSVDLPSLPTRPAERCWHWWKTNTHALIKPQIIQCSRVSQISHQGSTRLDNMQLYCCCKQMGVCCTATPCSPCQQHRLMQLDQRKIQKAGIKLVLRV